MANIYLRSTTGNDSNSGAGWATAKATLAGAYAVAAAGDTIYVSQAHAESIGGVTTLTSAGVAGNRVRVICVQDSAEPPTTLATAAVISNNANTTLLGFTDFYGITFDITSNGAILLGLSSNDFRMSFDNCRINLGTGASGRVYVGGNHASAQNQRADFYNMTLRFGNTSQGVIVRGATFTWLGGTVDSAGTAPTSLFLNLAGTIAGITEVGEVDFSFLGSGKNLVAVGTGRGSYTLRNCKLGSSVTPISGTVADEQVTLLNCDSASTNYRHEIYSSNGSQLTETTRTKTGGATDGSTAISWQMTTLSNGSSFYTPLRSVPIAIWNETTGSPITVSVEILHDSATALKDDDVWLAVEYLSATGSPLGAIVRDRKTDILSTGSNQTASSATWTTTGLTNPNKQKLDVTFTPQKKGMIVARVAMAKTSYSIYVDPLLAISGVTSGRQYMGPYGTYVNEGPSTGGGGSSAGSFVVVQ